METEEEIRKNERVKYTRWYFENVYWKEDSSHDPMHEKRFRFMANLLVKHFKFNTFLDAGCGTGQITRNILGKGYACKGIEISDDALKYYMSDLAKKKIIFLAGLEKMPFQKNQSDLVFCSDVMEHIPIFDIENSIKELIRVTKRYLVLTINLNHVYEYHPTILSRDTWENLFLGQGKLRQLKTLENKIQNECRKKYNEYDFFVFQKIKTR